MFTFDPKQNFNRLNAYILVLHLTMRNSSFLRGADLMSRMLPLPQTQIVRLRLLCRALRVIRAFTDKLTKLTQSLTACRTFCLQRRATHRARCAARPAPKVRKRVSKEELRKKKITTPIDIPLHL